MFGTCPSAPAQIKTAQQWASNLHSQLCKDSWARWFQPVYPEQMVFPILLACWGAEGTSLSPTLSDGHIPLPFPKYWAPNPSASPAAPHHDTCLHFPLLMACTMAGVSLVPIKLLTQFLAEETPKHAHNSTAPPWAWPFCLLFPSPAEIEICPVWPYPALQLQPRASRFSADMFQPCSVLFSTGVAVSFN